MSQLRVIEGGEQAESICAEDLPVPVAQLQTPDFTQRPQNGVGRYSAKNRGTMYNMSGPAAVWSPQNPGSQDLLEEIEVNQQHSVRAVDTTNFDQHDVLALPVSANVVAVVSALGGVGKTTIAANLAATFSRSRPGPVVAVDLDKSPGNLGERLAHRDAPVLSPQNSALKSRETIRAQAMPSPSGVDVVGAPVDADETAQDTSALMRALRRHYDLVVVDTTSAFSSSSNRAAISAAHLVVVVTGPNRQGANAASQTIDWLRANGHSLDEIVLVINGVPSTRGARFIGELDRHFSSLVAAVIHLPLDNKTLSSEQTPGFSRLSSGAQQAFLGLAAEVLSQLRTTSVIDLDHAWEDVSSSAELRIMPSIEDHNASVPLGTQPTPVVFARQNNEGEN